MEIGEKCYIISLPFKAIQWSTGFKGPTDFRISVSPIKANPNEEKSCSASLQVAVLNEKGSTFVDQPKNGVQYTDDYFMFKNLSTIDFLGLRIEFYTDQDEKPSFSSFAFFENKSPGIIQSPIINTELNVVGRIKVEYLRVNPYPFKPSDLDNGLCTDFSNFLRKGVHVGHRGAGVTRREDLSDNILENTILSLNHAVKHGADMVEFDVHLSKDDVPILYHDFSVYVQLSKKGSNDHEILELPVKDLTYRQLKILKLGPKRDHGDKFEFREADNEDNQPFCKLVDALNTVSPCAFNIEIKYPTGSENYKDLNHFVDTILKTISEHHNNRNIIISSFDPAVCAMANLKQKKFPVLFLTDDLNVSKTYVEDERMASIEMACYYASAMGFSGVNCYAQNLITDKSLVRYVLNKDLLLFCYGGNINASSIVEELIKEGVHGVIYDRIDVISPKKLLSSATSAASQDGDTQEPVVRKKSATIFSISHES